MGILSIFNVFRGGSDEPVPGRVTVEEFKAMLSGREDISIIDVRTPGEYTAGHIPGAMSTPLDEIMEGADVPYGNRIILYCASGNRSRTAWRVLTGRGKKNVEDLAGGIKAWIGSKGVVISD